MKISFDNLVARVEDVTDAESAWLFDFLSFSDTTFAFRGKVKRYRIFNLISNTFPAGNLGSVVREWRRLRDLPTCELCHGERVINARAGTKDLLFVECQACKNKEIRPKWIDTFALHDQRVRPCAPCLAGADLDWLHWYQREAVVAVTQTGRGIVKIPTGGGKTEVFVGLTRAVPCRWLFIAHRAQLLINGAKRWLMRERESLQRELAALFHADCSTDVPAECFEQVETKIDNLRVGRFGDGEDDVRSDDRVVFATFQSLHAAINGRGREILEAAEAVAVDECHVQPADSFFAVTQAAKNAYFRVGLSGTPLQRGDRRNVLAIGALGKVIYKISIKTLIEEGVYARPSIMFVETLVARDVPDSTKCTRCQGTGEAKEEITGDVMPCGICRGSGLAKPKYATVYKHAIVQSKSRNARIADVAQRAAKPSMLFVEKRDHGKILKKLIEKLGINVRFLDGTKNTEAREKAIKDLARGEIDVVITTRIMQEGIDLPSLASVINAGAGKSMIGVLQRIGRGARTTTEKQAVEFWDFFDGDHEALRRQANARKKALTDETGCQIVMVPVGAALPLVS